MAPTGQGGHWQEVLCCTICTRHFNDTLLPVSLICGHVICRPCAEKAENQAKPCPHDDWKPTCEPKSYPNNVALLSVIFPRKQCMSFSSAKTDDEKKVDFLSIQISKFFREADSERGGTVSSKFKEISRTLQRKVVALLCYQWCEPDGRAKSLKMCRGIAERILIEIILNIQANTHVSSQLWSAVRARGCQFLGPAMQDDVLRLILMTLETGECIARKNLVMYVVQTLGSDYPQVSKTCVGHVVQLLYRASCFNVLKRDGESSLMQLKEEFRTYEALRREHDSQIVQIACESGLRIGPDQWSALLYADQSHRSHMQSIIDKLQSRNSYLQGIDELRALITSPTSFLLPPYRHWLSQVLPCLEHFANTDQQTDEVTWPQMAESMAQVRTLLRLHCQQDEQRHPPVENCKPSYQSQQMPLPFHHFAPGGPPLLPSHEKIFKPADLKPQRKPEIAACANALKAYHDRINGSRAPVPPSQPSLVPPTQSKPAESLKNAPNAEGPASSAQAPPSQGPRQQQHQNHKPRYQMGIPPNRAMNYVPPQQQFGTLNNFYQPQPFPPHPHRMKGPRRGPPPSGPPRGTQLPMLIGFPPDMGMMANGTPRQTPMPMMTPMVQGMGPMGGPSGGMVVQGDGGVVQVAIPENGQIPPPGGPPPPPPQPQLVIMQSPTHLNGAPVVMIPPPPPSVTPVPLGAMTPQGASIPVQVPSNALWTAASPTGSMVFPAASPTGQPPHTIWIQSTDNQMFPMFDYTSGAFWGPGTMLRESGADAEQLLAKRHEILKRLHPSEDDDDPEDGGVGHVSYTVASSVLDDRMDHHPMGMMSVPAIDLPAIPISFASMPTEETMTMIGEMVQQNNNRPRAASLTSSTSLVVGAAPTASSVIGSGGGNGTPTTVQSECGTMSVMVDSPLAHAPIATAAIQTTAAISATPIPLVPVVTAPEPFNPSVPPPQPGQPMLVDSATGLLTPIRPILVAHPQNVVSISLDKIVDVKERLSEAQGSASEAENAHLRMELRMAESEMNHLDPYTKNNCLLRELQQVDRELQQLQIEPIRQ